MYVVKLSINAPIASVISQTPKNLGIWGDYKFHINDDIDECDFWVIYSKGQRINETVNVPPENIIFISGEPETIYHYDKRFVNQFSTVVTTRQDIKHSNIIYDHPGQPWHIGRVVNGDCEITINKDYDFLSKKKLCRKDKLMSVVCSNKAFSKGHQDRIDFVYKLKSHFGDKLSVYGRGFNPIPEKWEAIAPYKYHIAIENSRFPYYWTEKLADSFLGETFPFYCGCKNIDRYFPPESFSCIDIDDVDKSIDIIENCLNKNIFEEKYKDIIDAKELVLNKYNLVNMIKEICDKLNGNLPKKNITIRHEMSFFDPYKIPILASRLFYKIKEGIK